MIQITHCSNGKIYTAWRSSKWHFFGRDAFIGCYGNYEYVRPSGCPSHS